MRKVCFVIVMAILMFSCVKKEQSAAIRMDTAPSLESEFLQSKVIQDLQAYNDSLMNSISETRLTSGGRNALIAGADVVGFMNGWSDGSNVGFWAGWFLGHPVAGKIIGGAVGGLMVGAAYSWMAGKYTKTVETKTAVEIYNNIVNSLISSRLLECINISADNTISFDLAQMQPYLPVVLPEDNSEAIFIGQAHNVAVQAMLEPESLAMENMEQTGKIDYRILDAIYSEELKNMFIENYNNCLAYTSNLSTDALMLLDKTGKGGIIVNQYLQLHDIYVMDTEDSIEITNRYIEIVNSSNELTNDEKQLVNSALTLASYSTDFWTNF